MSKCSNCGEDQSVCGSGEDRSVRPPASYSTEACRLIAQLKSERGTELDLHHVLLLSEADRFAVADKLDCSPLKVKTLWELFETTVKSRMLDVNRKLKVKTLEI